MIIELFIVYTSTWNLVEIIQLYRVTSSVISFYSYYVSYGLYHNVSCIKMLYAFVMYISEDSPLEVYKKYHEDDKEGGPFLFVGQ